MNLRFPQEKGINAAEIRERANRRNAEARAAEHTAAVAVAAGPSTSAPKEKAKGKGKAAAKKKRKRNDDFDSDFELPEQSNAPKPGQITFCAECESRFTVTAYTCAPKDRDGLLCSKCGSKYGKDNKAVKKKRASTKTSKRDKLRNALDNNQTCIAKSLKDYCIEVCTSCLRITSHGK